MPDVADPAVGGADRLDVSGVHVEKSPPRTGVAASIEPRPSVRDRAWFIRPRPALTEIRRDTSGSERLPRPGDGEGVGRALLIVEPNTDREWVFAAFDVALVAWSATMATSASAVSVATPAPQVVLKIDVTPRPAPRLEYCAYPASKATLDAVL